jgi:uncharacterized protein (TIGR02145 family)
MAYYVDQAAGNNANPGTITLPWRTATYAWNQLVAGDMLYMRGGNYDVAANANNVISVSGKAGTQANPILVINYPGETVTIDGTSLNGGGDRNGLYMSSCSYWQIAGIKILNVSDAGGSGPASVSTLVECDHIIMTLVEGYDCSNGFRTFECDYIYRRMCDAYQNADTYDSGDLANGFWDRVTNGGHIYYEDCRAWSNSDDGWDAYAAGYGDGWIYYNRCWSFENGTWNGISGNGAGFKVGLTGIDAIDGTPQRVLTNCISANNTGNTGIGYDESQDQSAGMSIPTRIYNCISYNNTVGFLFRDDKGDSSVEHVDIVRNCISYNETPFYGWGNNTQDHNSWNGFNISSSDFVSLDGNQLKAARQSDGNLPVTTFMHLTANSVLIGKGISVGLETDGERKQYFSPPSIGVFEYGSVIPSVTLVTGIVVSGAGSATTITVDKGTLQMSAAVTPSGATNKNVVWSKTNGTGKAIISYTGLLTAQTDGTVTVKATAVDGSGVYGELEITISNQVVPTLVTSIVLSTTGDIDAITIDKGSIQINKTVSPGGSSQIVLWTISDNAFANISESGILTAITNGIVTVRATATDGSDIYGEIVITISNQVDQGIALLAPDGWHIPSETEWQELIDYLGGTTLAGGKLKETGLVNWDTPNTGADNISGFTALGAGYRIANGTFGALKENNCTWSATEVDSANAHRLNLAFDDRTATIVDADKKCGCTVRCVKDDSVDPGTMKDIDGNIYPTVKIGNQVWMGEDLRVTRLRDGTPIPLVTDNTEWANLTGQGYCWYNNTP